MVKRPGAAALAGGALLALLCSGPAAAQDGQAFPREVSGGFVSWSTADAELADRGVSFHGAGPAVRGSADRTWFPATGGGAHPGTGDAEVELSGTAQLAQSAGTVPPLTLGGLRLELGSDAGALYSRTAADGGTARELALAKVALGEAAPAVRTGGVTWTGLRASLTPEGARLLSEWSGRQFAAGDGLGLLDVTVGTGAGGTPEVPARPDPTRQPSPSAAPEKQQRATPSAALTRPGVTAGAEQEVTGAGFEPGEVVLVAIDADTRYQAVADQEGRVSRVFPVYATAAEGAHGVELYSVLGERRAAARFEVLASD
ncbi:HtaA domain-containing protein [Streptomyces sp. AC555_RSS877]|uniref:HtaA domain-containing protein n=1 Tax=Streptomyces sp. AC555_RSS877 TaxID=2823688 RepID=UPI001C258154|nr:HtaA domain-containing protein [Streptomyces sp. AC555_RSS877]